jgi:hypothetical protein
MGGKTGCAGMATVTLVGLAMIIALIAALVIFAAELLPAT